MPKSTSVCNSILALIYNATNWANIADNASSSPITNITLALKTASDTPSSTMNTNETVYTNYVRVSVARTTGGWDAPSSSATANATAINFAQCGVTGATITSAATGVGAGAAAILHYGDLNSPIAVSNLIRPTFDAGSISITEQ